jgi:hypothetical protein
MKKRYIKLSTLLICGLACLLLIGCASPEARLKSPLNKIDNEKKLEELITKTTDTEDIHKLIGDFYENDKVFYADDVDAAAGIECLRKNGDIYYSVHKQNNGKYLYLFYALTDGRLQFEGSIDRNYEFIEGDFDFVKPGVTTETQIRAFDKHTPDCLTGMRTTMHCFVNGTLIIYYRYSESKGDFVVESKEFQLTDENNYLKKLLPGDIR